MLVKNGLFCKILVIPFVDLSLVKNMLVILSYGSGSYLNQFLLPTLRYRIKVADQIKRVGTT